MRQILSSLGSGCCSYTNNGSSLFLGTWGSGWGRAGVVGVVTCLPCAFPAPVDSAGGLGASGEPSCVGGAGRVTHWLTLWLLGKRVFPVGLWTPSSPPPGRSRVGQQLFQSPPPPVCPTSLPRSSPTHPLHSTAKRHPQASRASSKYYIYSVPRRVQHVLRTLLNSFSCGKDSKFVLLRSSVA